MTECWCGSHLRVDAEGVVWCAADDEHEPFEAHEMVAS